MKVEGVIERTYFVVCVDGDCYIWLVVRLEYGGSSIVPLSFKVSQGILLSFVLQFVSLIGDLLHCCTYDGQKMTLSNSTPMTTDDVLALRIFREGSCVASTYVYLP